MYTPDGRRAHESFFVARSSSLVDLVDGADIGVIQGRGRGGQVQGSGIPADRAAFWTRQHPRTRPGASVLDRHGPGW